MLLILAVPILLMAWFVLILDGVVVMRRVKKPEPPYVRPSPEEEDDLVHGLWAIKDAE